MKKEIIPLSNLTGLSQEAGEKLLLEAGYIQFDLSCDDDEHDTGEIYHIDNYYQLCDEDDCEIDMKTWVMLYEKAEDVEDDCRDDKFIDSYWDGLYEKREVKE